MPQPPETVISACVFRFQFFSLSLIALTNHHTREIPFQRVLWRCFHFPVKGLLGSEKADDEGRADVRMFRVLRLCCFVFCWCPSCRGKSGVNNGTMEGDASQE